MKKKMTAVLVALGLCSAGVALAADGPFMVRAHALYLDFHNGQASGLPLGGTTKIEAESRWIPEVDLNYFLTKNIATELVLTYPQNIDIKVGGATKGTIKALPPSLMLQYHFTDLGAIKPYVGAGVNYTIFTKRSNILGGAASVDRSSFGLAAQAGVDIALDKQWSFNLDVKYIQMDTDVKVGGAKVGKVNLNPTTFGIGLGYRF